MGARNAQLAAESLELVSALDGKNDGIGLLMNGNHARVVKSNVRLATSPGQPLRYARPNYFAPARAALGTPGLVTPTEIGQAAGAAYPISVVCRG